jgi:glycolate oxidase FAD binding subunit
LWTQFFEGKRVKKFTQRLRHPRTIHNNTAFGAHMDTSLHPVTDRIRTAMADSTPLRLRGHGSKDFYGNSLQGQVLDTTALHGIVSYEPSELVVTVRAGTPLAELEQVLAERGQSLPFEPPHFGRSATSRGGTGTVGGMVASGLAGPARASVGGVREYVLGLQLINGRAEQLVFGGQVMKNVAGYDVSRLMVGAMGTLGLITEVSLKVMPVAPAEATLVFELDQLAALEQLHRWGGQPLPLNASCWVRDDSEPALGARNLLFVRLRGAVAAVEAACKKMLSEVQGQRMNQEQAQADWTRCRHQQLPFFKRPADEGCVLWRLSLPQTAPVLDLPWPQLVEWHGALRWLWAPMDAADRLQSAASQSGGSATLFVAFAKNNSADRGAVPLAATAQSTISQRLKESFDPQGLFNPGRMPVQL